MKVFNTYLKVLKTLMIFVIIYPVIFFGLNTIVNVSNNDKNNTDFEVTKPRVAIINEDKDSVIVKSFIKYFDDHTEIIELDNDDETLKDALFYRRVIYIVKFDKDFTNKFLNDELVKLDAMKLPDDNNSMIVDNLINNYFNTAKTYLNVGFEEEEATKHTIDDLNTSVNISFSEESSKGSFEGPRYYFNFTYYILMALSTAIVGLIMISFNRKIIKRRTMCSPLKISRYNLEIMLGNLLVVFGFCLLFILGSFIFYGGVLLSIHGLLFILNTLCMAIFVLMFSLLLGNLVNSLEVQGAISTVVALATSFLCGVFVPLELLGDGVIALAKVFPAYWYVLANDTIANIQQFTSDNVLVIIKYMLIQIGYAIAVYIIMLIVQKKKARD